MACFCIIEIIGTAILLASQSGRGIMEAILVWYASIINTRQHSARLVTLFFTLPRFLLICATFGSFVDQEHLNFLVKTHSHRAFDLVFATLSFSFRRLFLWRYYFFVGVHWTVQRVWGCADIHAHWTAVYDWQFRRQLRGVFWFYCDSEEIWICLTSFAVVCVHSKGVETTGHVGCTNQVCSRQFWRPRSAAGNRRPFANVDKQKRVGIRVKAAIVNETMWIYFWKWWCGLHGFWKNILLFFIFFTKYNTSSFIRVRILHHFNLSTGFVSSQNRSREESNEEETRNNEKGNRFITTRTTVNSFSCFNMTKTTLMSFKKRLKKKEKT